MSNTAGTPGRHNSGIRRTWSETTSALKTTEFYAWIVVSLAILIASAVVDNGDDGQGFGADHAWLYVAIVTAAYIVSRGIAKAGVNKPESDTRDVNGRSITGR
ncbi:hypothetical protein [Curtobacterium sp. ISL-83]|uniref:hypothetical protein n=1 Tax=Curtobacterium sp. ISL-83 TaxID=2819145 RepID=UPI001BEC0F75|nr:hypothetical protein [Curtobacterium sp. ISL-83]MBT2504082.1 hypothetical protein [Curtobacterium sp. ISL-83]